MTTKKIIEQDICATCVNVCLLEPPPPTGPWEKKALCTAGWPYTRVFASANAIDECPQYERRTAGVGADCRQPDSRESPMPD